VWRSPIGQRRRLLRRIGRSEDGQALVEFALVAPLILLLIFGILDFGRAFNYKNDLTSLANQAARFAEVNTCLPCGGASIATYVASTADSPALRNGSSTVTPVKITFCFPNGSKGAVGDELKVTAASTYSWLPLINGVVHSPSSALDASVIVRVQTAYGTNNVYTAAAC
jgi:Flp pilus assembly pilin Flp